MSPVDQFPAIDPIPASTFSGPAVPPPPAYQKLHPAFPPPPSRRHLPRFLVPGFISLVLVTGLATAVWQIRQRQLFSSSAWDCHFYSYQVTPDGTVTVTNNTSRRPAQKAQININHSPVAVFTIPSLDLNQTTAIGKISPPMGGILSWQVIGTAGCSATGSYTPTPAVSTYTPILLIPTFAPTP